MKLLWVTRSMANVKADWRMCVCVWMCVLWMDGCGVGCVGGEGVSGSDPVVDPRAWNKEA